MACDNREDVSPVDESETETANMVEFDPETDSVTMAIVTAVADLESLSPMELDPLYDVIEPEALDSVVQSVTNRSGMGNAEITVQYHGYTITVHSYGVIEIAHRGEI